MTPSPPPPDPADVFVKSYPSALPDQQASPPGGAAVLSLPRPAVRVFGRPVSLRESRERERERASLASQSPALAHHTALPTATHRPLPAPRLSLATHRHRTKMAEKFVGKWKLESTENFDDYMKAVGKYGTSPGRLRNVGLTRVIPYSSGVYFQKNRPHVFIGRRKSWGIGNCGLDFKWREGSDSAGVASVQG